MNKLVIRPATPADVPHLSDIVASADYLQRYGGSLDSPEAYVSRALAGGICLIAETNSRPAGLIWFSDSGTLGRGGYIRLIVVHARAKGQGIGRALMAEAERRIFSQSQHAFLLTSHFNIHAQAFYEKLGWIKCGELPGFVAADITEYLYWKRRPAAD